MATTIETLFGLDPAVLQLKQAQIGASQDASFGALMPKGYGALGAAVSKLGRNTIGKQGMFGSNDPALNKSSKIEAILAKENQTPGTPLETYKRILTEMQKDPSLGRETMLLNEKIATEEKAIAKIAYTQAKDAIELTDKLAVSKASIEDKYSKQSDRALKRLEAELKINPDFFVNQAKAALPTSIPANDFNGDTTGTVLKELTMQLIDARKTDENGNATGVMFNGYQQALKVAKKILKDSDPKAGFWSFTDDVVNRTKIDKLVINEVSRRNGRPENLDIEDNNEVAEDTPVGPNGTTFVEMTPDGKAIFKYPDGREVVAKGNK